MSLALDTTKKKEIDRKALKLQRDIDLMAIVHNFGDGRVMQVRPIDVGNIQMVIGQGQPRPWVMEDNTVHTVTVPELQTALASGVAQADVIWTKYMNDLQAL